jgi:shikimate dehydrogenase
MKKFAVIGSPIEHSLSPTLYQLFAKHTGITLEYIKLLSSDENFSNDVKHFFSAGGAAVNITVPFKELAFHLADRLTDRAQKAGAVNMLSQQDDGLLVGDNTDGVGFVNDLKNNQGIDLNDKMILIVGAGGSAKGILNILLDQAPKKIVIMNRTIEKAKALAAQDECISVSQFDDELQQFDLIINATSLSLQNKRPALSEKILKSTTLCYDLFYAKNATPFMAWATEYGAKSCDGLGMLVEQGAENFSQWYRVDVSQCCAQVLENIREY